MLVASGSERTNWSFKVLDLTASKIRNANNIIPVHMCERGYTLHSMEAAGPCESWNPSQLWSHVVCFATWEPGVSPRDLFPQAQVFALGCLWGVRVNERKKNKHVTINQQHTAGSNHRHWSSLGAGDAGVAACLAAAVSSSCSCSLSHLPFQAEERKIWIAF